MSIKNWNLFNQKYILAAKEYVDNNFIKLIHIYNISNELAEEDKKKILIEYFTKNPDQIKRLNVLTVRNGSNRLEAPTLNNIGGNFNI